MDGADGKARARAAYERVDAELLRQRWRLFGAAFVAIAIAAVLFLVVWANRQPVGPARLIEGTATGTLQAPSDEEHIVVLLVQLDKGQTVRLLPHDVVPIGARVIVKEGENWFGKPIYEYAGRAPSKSAN
jgi:hypothetical protein